MAMVRVWNITDDANSDVKPHNRMVLGKVLKPGQAVQVDADRLAKAHKVQRDVKNGLLHIGAKPPASYSARKNPPRAKADARRVDANGRFDGNRPVAPNHVRAATKVSAEEPAAEPATVEVADSVPVADAVEAELKPAEEAAEAPAEAPAEESTDEETKGSKKRRRGK